MKELLCLQILIFVVSPFCFSAEPSRSYSELLEKAVHLSYSRLVGYRLYSPRAHGYENPDDWPRFDGNVQLCQKEAVPFLIEVIAGGPDWPKEQDYLKRHVARCYATLCLAATEDRRAYPVLTDLLLNGTWLQDPNIPKSEGGILSGDNADPGMNATKKMPRIPAQDELEEYDIRAYGAIGLGMFGDPNAVALLKDTLSSGSPRLRQESFLALARLGDMRVIEAMIQQAAIDEAISPPLYGYGMSRFTMTSFRAKWNTQEGTISFVDFPELGRLRTEQGPVKTVWQHWFRTGRQWTQKYIEHEYHGWKEARSVRTQEDYVARRRAQGLVKPGIAALPFLVEKIAAGDSELIEQVSILTRGKVGKDASREEVLQWWDKDSERWIIPFKEE